MGSNVSKIIEDAKLGTADSLDLQHCKLSKVCSCVGNHHT